MAGPGIETSRRGFQRILEGNIRCTHAKTLTQDHFTRVIQAPVPHIKEPSRPFLLAVSPAEMGDSSGRFCADISELFWYAGRMKLTHSCGKLTGLMRSQSSSVTMLTEAAHARKIMIGTGLWLWGEGKAMSHERLKGSTSTTLLTPPRLEKPPNSFSCQLDT